MINRELIRLKAVQLAYACCEDEDRTLESAEKEFLYSLDKAYELYQNLLALMVNINHVATRIVEMQQSKARRLGEREAISTKFINNRFIAQLRENEQLQAFVDKNGSFWTDEDDMLRQFYYCITEQDYYQEYMQNGDSSYDEDRELWRKIYRNIICNNEELDDILEDHSLYWNDDKTIIDTFVLKTIRRFEEANGAKQPLLPEFREEEDREFALMLFRTALSNQDYFRQLIRDHTLNWELERIAVMDLVILQVALAEITSFPGIPLNVSINEYVEIAKLYSTPRSASYVNGMLDSIGKQLIKEGLIEKEA
ncbi:MAG: transcription antitermination factor NusB [Bacteroidaceae bacterium]|nr:transcription antitermination factor NusB [Bacteroidaceae bacterium]